MYTMSKKTQTPITFWYNFTSTALVSMKLGVENLHLILHYHSMFS